VLAPRQVPSSFVAWNRRWRAPSGPAGIGTIPLRRRLRWFRARRLGPFAFQHNNSTRAIEYPWAVLVATVVPQMRVVDIGGGLSGLQFVLARQRARVTNVDPFEDYGAGDYAAHHATPETLHARLNRCFRTAVELRRATLAAAGLPGQSIDRMYSISVIEHLGEAALQSTLAEVQRVLRPGGLFVLTVDLFLDLEPFTPRVQNRFGRNVSIASVVEQSGLELAWGRPDQLLGFPGFDATTIQSDLERYFVGFPHPTLAQLVVLRKPGRPSAGGALRPDVLERPPDPDRAERVRNRLRWYAHRLRGSWSR
jgi:2-polyprenyl-3-methyl-5-hydroxy-6-metoxy-1,4-benzoquinol methylase